MEIRPFEKVPVCIGIIMDGNRRWAQKEGLAPSAGHVAGYRKTKEVARWVREFGVKHLIVFALSTENLERSEEEVGGLMDLCRAAFAHGFDELADEGVRLRVIGDTARLPEDLRVLLRGKKEEIQKNDALWEDDVFELIIALSYGGREEIQRAALEYSQWFKALAAREQMSAFAGFLSTNTTPDPDLIIRTGGETRLSNFLLYQAAYSELFFSPTLWPDFSYWELVKILAEFQIRHRRFGK